MNFNDVELQLIRALRQDVGPDRKGVGPDIHQLLKLATAAKIEAEDLSAAITSLERSGFIKVDHVIANPSAGIPKCMRGIAGVSVMEPLQLFCDERM